MTTNPDALSLLSADQMVRSFGVKAAAQWALHREDLGPACLHLLPSDVTTWPDGALSFCGAHVLRVSPISGSTLNAPRKVCSTSHEALTAAAAMAAELPYDFAVILHTPTNPRLSLEISVGPSEMVLEHKPGLWELDNKQQPDRVEWHEDGVTVHRVCVPRVAHGLGVLAYNCPPLEWAELIKLALVVEELRPRLQRVRQWLGFEQAIFHAVADNGPLVFLNVRPTAAVRRVLGAHRPQRTVAIRTLEDVGRLTPGDIPHVITDADRGDHLLLLDVLEAIARDHSVISVPDGILSHTAIMARELGLTVVSPNDQDIYVSLSGTSLGGISVPCGTPAAPE